MSLIHAREIIWNDIIQQVKVIWDYMLIMVEEKTIVRNLEVIIVSIKEKSQQGSQLAKKMIYFLNSKSFQE